MDNFTADQEEAQEVKTETFEETPAIIQKEEIKNTGNGDLLFRPIPHKVFDLGVAFTNVPPKCPIGVSGIVREEAKQLNLNFREDGLFLPQDEHDILKRTLTKPQSERINDEMIKVQNPTSVSGFSQEESRTGLLLRLDHIVFRDHELLCREEVLAARLRELYGHYVNIVVRREVENISLRLQSLAAGMAEGPADADRAVQLFLQSFQALCDYVEAIEVVCSILRISFEAEEAGGSSGAAVDLEADQAGEAHLRTYFNNFADRFAEGAGVKQEVDEFERFLRTCRESSQDWQDEHKEWLAKADGLVDIANQLVAVRPSALGFEFVVQLSENAQVSPPESLTTVEASRRSDMRSRSYYIEIIVNGQRLHRTPAKRLQWPQLSVSFNTEVFLKVVTMPRQLLVRLVRKRWFWDDCVAEIPVAVPGRTVGGEHSLRGVAMQSASAISARYDFASADPISAGRFASAQQRHCSGDLFATTSWVRRHASREAQSDQLLSGKGGMSDSIVAVVAAEEGSGALNRLPQPRPPSAREEDLLVGKWLEEKMHLASCGDKQFIPDFARERDYYKHVVAPNTNILDPIDYRNQDLLHVEKAYASTHGRTAVFRVRSADLEGTFCTVSKPWSGTLSYRHRLLQFRTKQPNLFSTPIPLKDDEILMGGEMRVLLSKVNESAADASEGVGDDATTGVEGQRKLRIQEFVERVQATQRKMRKNAQEVSLPTVVKEGPLPNFRAMFDVEAIKKLLEPRRRLRPRASGRSAIVVAGHGGAQQEAQASQIFVQVVTGKNVPLRRGASGPSDASDPSGMLSSTASKDLRRTLSKSIMTSPSVRGGIGARFGEEQQSGDVGSAQQDVDGRTRVMSYVEIRFQSGAVRTTVQEGPNPQWNESLSLPFQPPRGDYTPMNLQRFREKVYISLFDELIERRIEDDRNPDEHREHLHRRYLGSFAIPFSTIYLNERVEGVFQLTMPPVNLGYAHSDPEHGSTSTYLHLLVTLNPPLAVVPPGEERLDVRIADGLTATVVAQATAWMKAKGDRNVTVFGLDVEDRNVLVTQFLRAQCPPPQVELSGILGGEEEEDIGATVDEGERPRMRSVEELARFVSLIPFLEDWNAFSAGDRDVWCTSQQFLDLLAGDWEEHAVLLCNYLQWVDEQDGRAADLENYIVLGHGVPEGETIYVMRYNRSTDEGILINASTGVIFNLRDTLCPLKSIGMIASGANMWMNIQVAVIPHKMNFNIRNEMHWKPFFSPGQERPPSIQNPQISYFPTHASLVNEMEMKILQDIKVALRRDRSQIGRVMTNFFSAAQESMREFLVMCERNKLGEVSSAEVEASRGRHLQTLSQAYDIYGFPINQPFTEVAAVVEEVKNTGVHRVLEDNVQFAVSVAVFPFSSNVCSVWVYIASLIKK